MAKNISITLASLAILIVLSFSMKGDLMGTSIYNDEDIVRNVEIVQESPYSVCVVREYCNPSSENITTQLRAKITGIDGNIAGIKPLMYLETPTVTITEKNCTKGKNFNAGNSSTPELANCKSTEKQALKEDWVEAYPKTFAEKTCFKTKQCFSKNQPLDTVAIEEHVPFLDKQLEKYTVITSSGYNQSLFNFTRLLDTYLSNDNATDSTGHYTVTNINGVTFKAFGKHLNASDNYDGSASKRNLLIEDLNVPGNYTCRAWVNISSTGSVNRNSIFTISNAAGNDNIFSVEKDATNKITALLDTGDTEVVQSASAYNDNLYHYIALVRNSTGTQETAILYIDGAKIGESTGAGDGETMSAETFRIGRFGDYDGYYDDVMDIDEFACWNYSMPGTDIAKDYTAGNGTFYDTRNIYGYYNSSTLFNRTVTISDCASTYTNISRNSTSFTTLNDGYNHSFAESGLGFYINIDTTRCTWVWLNATNNTITSCNCPASGNWNINASENCNIISDCNIGTRNLTCTTGSGGFTINKALIIANYTFINNTKCNVTIVNTGIWTRSG